MNIGDVRTIAAKDMWTALHRWGIVASLVLLPVLAGLGLPLVLGLVESRMKTAAGGVPANLLPDLLNAFLFFFAPVAAVLPTGISAYALVGEKAERSLEPLLATPVSDIDILLGKSIASLVPSVVATWAGTVLFIALADFEAYPVLGRLYFPNAVAAIMILAMIPLASALGVAINILVSSRAADVRTAQQVGTLPALPLGGLYVAIELGAVTLDAGTMLLVSGALLAVVAALFLTAHKTFNREEILTRWK